MTQLDLQLPSPTPGLIQLWTPDEIYDRLDATNISRFVEDRRVEIKSASVQPRALAEYLSMWSNTQPHGGLILVGIDDTGKLSGCKSCDQKHLNDLQSLTALCPDARWASKPVPIANHKGELDFIIAYRVNYRDDKLVETGGLEAFIREGDKKVRISETLKRELRISKGEIHYELEKVNLAYPDDFDIDEVGKFCLAFHENKKYPTAKTMTELLELAKLGKNAGGSFFPNLACALLFAKDPRDIAPGARIRVIKYDGTEERFGERLNAVFSTFVDGNIAKLLFNAKPIIASQLRSFQRFTASGRIVVQQEYPQEAWFEAVVNAVAHRSYNFKTQNIFVKIFDDRFVVESPGGFVPPTTSATVYDAHNPRNPYLMEAMMHLELTFCGFEGTRRMRQAMSTAKLPEPKFRQIEAHSHQVHVTLENNIYERKTLVAPSAPVRIAKEIYDPLSDDEKTIVEFLSAVEAVNVTNAGLLIGKSWPTTAKTIQSLLEKNVIELSVKRGRKHDSTKTYRLKDR